MAPHNVAQMLDNSNLDVIFEKFVNYLLEEQFLEQNKEQKLSLPQLKTIYNLNCKYHSDFLSQSGSIIEFEDLRQYAVVKKKLIIKANELHFPNFNIKTINTARSGFDSFLDHIADKHRQRQVQWLKDKAVRVQLERTKIVLSAIKFPVGKKIKHYFIDFS